MSVSYKPIILDDPKLIFFLTSNPIGFYGGGTIQVRGPDWALPALWPIVAPHVRDECLRPLPVRARANKPPRPFA